MTKAVKILKKYQFLLAFFNGPKTQSTINSGKQSMQTLEEAQREIDRLRKIVEAYDKLTAISNRELLDANKIIGAHEAVLSLSREEIMQLQDQIKDLETNQQNLQDLIRSILAEDSENEQAIVDKLSKVRQSSDDTFFVDLFRVLVHCEFPPDDAAKHWHSILKHSKSLSVAMKRQVGFRVAMLDYFVNLNKVLKNPVIIEISIIDEVIRNTLVDELTHLYNKRYFNRCLARELNRSRRHGQPLALVLLDLDDFKKFNDTHGHAAGDEALRTIGLLFRKAFRTEDYPCRFGGEEFAVILPHTDSQGALIVAERFLTELHETRFIGEKLTVSGGIAHYPDLGKDAITLFQIADSALYQAKGAGKDRILLG